jgi:hypothetical protein
MSDSHEVSVLVHFYDMGFQTTVKQKVGMSRIPVAGECICFTPVDRLTQTRGAEKKWYEVTLVVHQADGDSSEHAEIWAVEVDQDVEIEKSMKRTSGVHHR